MSDVIRAEGRDTTYETALELHEAIMHSAQAAALSLMEMCRGLKKMRDTRLYESLGHSSFDDYCEKMAGIRARQAYTYIAVYERFGEARLAANASLGVTKLELISRLPFSEQDSVLEAAGLEGMSVAELRAMAEQYRTVGHQTDMFAAAEAEPETADSVPGEVLEKARREAREESAAETAALRAQLEEAEAKHRAELEAEKARRRDEVEAAVKRRLKKESAEAAARAAEEARSRAEEEAAEKYGAELDELRSAATDGKAWLSQIQLREQERTGIRSLKVKYNSVFGYYIEVSKANLSMVPEDYVRKQTLVNAERFITPELKELESKILGAEEKAKALEAQLFQELREFALQYTVRIQTAADALAGVDALASLAECARLHGYRRPRIFEDDRLIVKAGRHPVLDAAMGTDKFVPNDCLLDGDRNRMMLITGPNMAGKSTYIRQTALLVVLAQMGSFVPAESMELGLVDRIFTRVGAADDLARGQSTFMVEMVETANILNHVTPKSLVILDEIGRGTSTFDGLSIAWAVAEFLHDDPSCRCRTQFATHYHELTELAQTRRGVNNYNVAVKEYGDQIIFLRQIVPGSTDRSYGIHVAKLAGIPQPVIERANVILELLEKAADAPRDAISALPRQTVKARRRKGDVDENDDMIQLRLL